MNVNCIICSDLFNPSDEIYATRCGHAFHQTCLLQWVERSKSCPQCRAKVTDKTIFKIFFNFLNTEGITLDAGSLQVKLDNVEFQLKEKDKEIMLKKSEVENMNRKILKSEEALLNAKEKLKTKEVALTVLKEHMEYTKEQCKQVTQLSKDKEKLQKDLILLKGMEEIIYGTAAEVEVMLKSPPDISSMCTYVTALKRASADLHNKKKHLAETVRGLQNQLSKSNTEKLDHLAKISTLEDSLAHAELEIKQLKGKIAEMESKQSAEDCPQKVCCVKIEQNLQIEASASELSKRKYAIDVDESPSPPKARKLLNKSKSLQVESQPANRTLTIKQSAKTIQDSTSPYLNLRQSSALAALQLKKPSTINPSTKAADYSIFKTYRIYEKLKSENNGGLFEAMLKKRTERETTYDGLGGHSKPDIFPLPKKNLPSSSPKKLSLKNKMKRVERPASQATIKNTFKKI